MNFFMVTLLTSLTANAQTVENCNDIKEVHWTDKSHGAQGYVIAANSKHDNVWIISSWSHSTGGYAIAKFDEESSQWKKDSSQPIGSAIFNNGIAVDPQGNPAYIDTSNNILWKKSGKWTELKGCAKRIAFGGDGSLYKGDCNDEVQKFDRATEEWTAFSKQKAQSIAVDDEGTLWVRDLSDKILKWNSSIKGWVDTGLSGGHYVAAGSSDQVYALAAPRKENDLTIYRYTGETWAELPEKAGEEIAVGLGGRLYLTSDRPKDHSIFQSYAFKSDWPEQRKVCEEEVAAKIAEDKANGQVAECENSTLCTAKAQVAFDISKPKLLKEIEVRQAVEAREQKLIKENAQLQQSLQDANNKIKEMGQEKITLLALQKKSDEAFEKLRTEVTSLASQFEEEQLSAAKCQSKLKKLQEAHRKKSKVLQQKKTQLKAAQQTIKNCQETEQEIRIRKMRDERNDFKQRALNTTLSESVCRRDEATFQLEAAECKAEKTKIAFKHQAEIAEMGANFTRMQEEVQARADNLINTCQKDKAAEEEKCRLDSVKSGAKCRAEVKACQLDSDTRAAQCQVASDEVKVNALKYKKQVADDSVTKTKALHKEVLGTHMTFVKLTKMYVQKTEQLAKYERKQCYSVFHKLPECEGECIIKNRCEQNQLP